MTSKTVAFLKSIEGVWIGEGRGVFPPRVPEFRYTEELTIKQSAKPVIFEYRSATRRLQTGEPMHVEVGFIRCPMNSDSIELLASHPFGVAEASHGSLIDSNSMELNCSEPTLLRTHSSGGVQTTKLKRTYRFDPANKQLLFSMDMATDQHPDLQNHLVCTMRKQT